MTTDQTPFVLDVVASPPSVWNGQPLTCQTCDVRREQQGDATVTCDSGDCVDGHPIISVDVPCQHCTEGVCGGGRDEGGTRWYCQHCWSEDFQRGTGTRQVRASAQAVPIMAYTALYDPRHLHAHVSLSRDGSHYTYFPEDKDERTHIVTVPDGARPGQFAIIATPVPAESPIEGDDQ